MKKNEGLINWKKEIVRSMFWFFAFSICCGTLSATLLKFATIVDPPEQNLWAAQGSAEIICSFVVLAAMIGRLFVFFEKSPASIPWGVVAIIIFRLCFNHIVDMLTRLEFSATHMLWAQRYVERPEKWIAAILLVLSVELVAKSDATLQQSKGKITEANKRVRRT